MKWILKGSCFFVFITIQLFAEDKNALQDACGCVCLSAEQIEGLDSWEGVKKACIGSDGLKIGQTSGLIVQTHSAFKNDTGLKEICFEEESLSGTREFIAERSVKSIGAKKSR